jgi:hypothetical protein
MSRGTDRNFVAFCATCGKIIEWDGKPVDWPNGPTVEAAAKLHIRDCSLAAGTEHEVLVGYRITTEAPDAEEG